MDSIEIIPTIADHREALVKIISETDNINQEEKDCAIELLDTSLNKDSSESEDYITLTALNDETVVGFVCYGGASLSKGSFDLYWILVDSASRGEGIGSMLLNFAESNIKASGGRILIAETSGRDEYCPTCNFYKRNGYIEEARIKNFFTVGDDKLFFVKVL